jgi:hypothetical protein
MVCWSISQEAEAAALTIELLKMQQEQVNALGLLLYRKGLSSRDVSEIK